MKDLEECLTSMPVLSIDEMRVRVSRNCVRLEVFAASQEQLLNRADVTLLRDWLTAALERGACECFPLAARGTPGDLEIYCPKCGKVFRTATDTTREGEQT
jgi:hypothetical protein